VSALDPSALGALLHDAPSNWGRWGVDDEIGALNYLGPTEVKAGLAAVRRGQTFTLGTSVASDEGDPVFPGRWPPRRFTVADESAFRSGRFSPLPGGLKFADDYVNGFTQAGTHCDALGHMWFGHEIYNGFDADSTIGGMTKAGIEPIGGHGITGRCVLLDIARHRGKAALDRAETFTHDDLLDCAQAQGIEIAPRSILLVRTGWLGAIARGEQAVDADYWEPGLTYNRQLADWFQRQEIPCLVTDTLANESTYEPNTGAMLPLHAALMRNLGVQFTEVAELDVLAADCAEDAHYEGLYCASPIKISHGTGGSVNPVVIK